MQAHTLREWLTEQGVDTKDLARQSRLDDRVVEAIVAGRYTTSPQQRKRIAAALGVPEESIQWSGAAEVDHMYGHGPQFGRSP